MKRAISLYWSCEGKPGLEALSRMSTHLHQAFAVYGAARAAKLDEDLRNISGGDGGGTGRGSDG